MFYSDSAFEGELRDLGPYSILNPVGGRNPLRTGARSPALVLRVDYRIDVDSVLDPNDPRTTVDSYHGGWVDDEMAALLSLSLGVRCRSGGLTRAWWGPKADPFGSPAEFHHRPPYLPPPEHETDPVIPGLARRVALGPISDLLSSYPSVPAKDASALVRAARLYQSALWIADGDAHLAWLQLVSALEAVAVRDTKDKRSHIDRIRAGWPELADALSGAPHETRVRVARLLAHQVKVTNRIVQFVRTYGPQAPARRPDWGRVSWETIPELTERVYRWRSRALHEGVPMPAPMCAPPFIHNDVPEEGAASSGYGSGGASWTQDDIPLLLHTFAYIVRGSIVNWWKTKVPVSV